MKIAKREKSVMFPRKSKPSLQNGKIKKKVSKDKLEKKVKSKVKSKLKKPEKYGKMTMDDNVEENGNISEDDQTKELPQESPQNGSAKTKVKTKSKKEKYSKMSMDDFMAEDEESEEEIDDISDAIVPKNEKGEDSGSESEEEPLDLDEMKSHKQSLSKLKEIDPEFYKFLEENDKKLLNFNISDSEGEGDDSDAEEKDGDDEGVHKPADELEVASDEDDFEPDGEPQGDGRNITLNLLKKWQNDIRTDKSAKTIGCLAKAFHAALVRVSTDDNKGLSEYRVDGSSVFNAVIQLCVLELSPAIRRYLKLPVGSKQAPHKCKKFVKIKTLLKGYFLDLLKLISGVTSMNIQNVLLKHLHGMSCFIVSYSNIAKKMLRRLIHLWGTAEESVRVVAFLCIIRITTNQQSSYLDLVLKTMYMTYVKNCKFMSLSTLAEINFMRRSLVEIFALDINVSYQHVFLYVRQLAIQLRSAVTLHKKEHIQGVYNWQYINSLHLWAALLTATCNKQQLHPLIYPLVQVAIGTIKLVPTAQYFPLRFHILQILTELSRDTNIFIPVLPLLLEVLTSYDFNKKHKKVSMKPINFTCLLRLSKSQMMENGFKDAVIDTLYGLLLEYLATQSYSISFPDTSLLCVMHIKQFLKKCSVANYNKKLRQILEKIDQNTQFIEKERKKITFNITDFKQIDAWETNIKNKGTPLLTFYESWKKLHLMKKQKEATNNDALADFNLPVLRKGQKPRDIKRKEGPVELFPSDSEDEMEVIEEKPKQKRGKRGAKKQKTFETVSKDIDDDVDDVVEDMKASDW